MAKIEMIPTHVEPELKFQAEAASFSPQRSGRSPWVD